MKTRHLQLEQQLASVPIRNERVNATREDGGRVLVVAVALRYPWWGASLHRLLRLRAQRRFRLDGVGLEVYESIDGHKNFEALVDEFAARHKLTFFESRALLMQYMRTLMSRGLIVIGVRPA